MARTIEFSVHGKPQQRGSKSPIPYKKKDGKMGVRVVDSNQNSQPWMQAVRHAAMEAYRGEPILGPVCACFYFYFARPKYHHVANDYSRPLTKKAPKMYHTQTPDLSKLIRCAEDAITGICWKDDAQVATYSPSGKFWTDGPPKMDVVIIELEGSE